VKPVPLGERGAKGKVSRGIYDTIERDSMELEASFFTIHTNTVGIFGA